MGDTDCDDLLIFVRRVLQDFSNIIGQQMESMAQTNPEMGELYQVCDSVLQLCDALEQCLDSLAVLDTSTSWAEKFEDV